MKILIPVDGSDCGQAAVDFVVTRTTLIGTQPEIELLNVQPGLSVRATRAVGAAAARSFHEDEADKVLKPASKSLARAGFDAQAVFRVGEVGIEVGKAAAADGIDLIIMGSHGHTALQGLVMGSVAGAVLAHSTVPVLLIRGSTAPKRDALKVCIAVDGSAFGLAAVRYVVEHRVLFGADPSFAVLHVLPDYTSIVIPGFAEAPVALMSLERMERLHDEQFEKVVAPVRRLLAKADLQAEEVRLVGPPGEEIAAWAKQNKPDMLVLGSHGRGAFKSLVMGSVVTRVAARTQVPLLLVREK
jgi:nucleotide-binding universal stress UspA family protein